MLKTSTILSYFFVFASLFLVSCEYEALEGEFPINETDPTDPDDPDNPGDPTSGGLYFPLALDNSWSYTEEFSPESSFVPSEGPLEVTGTTSVEGIDYFLIPAFFSPSTDDMGIPEGMDITIEINGGGAIRHEEGNYFQVSDLTMNYDMMGQQFSQSMSISPILFLKENAEVGASWTQNATVTMTTEVMGSPQSSTQDVTYIMTIFEKDVTATINGQTFEDVIKISIDDMETVSEIWFAKNVGPIHLYSEISATDWYKREIDTYTLN